MKNKPTINPNINVPDWARKADWNKSDAELSRELDLTRERIRQVRKQLGLPSSRTIKKPRRFKINLKNADWSKTDVELAAIYHVNSATVAIQRRLFAPQTVKSRATIEMFKDVDFNLPIREIQKVVFDNYGVLPKQQSVSRFKAILAPHLVKKRTLILAEQKANA